MKIEYWIIETNTTINQIREYTLLLMESKVNMRFTMKQQLVKQEKKWNDIITIRINKNCLQEQH